MTAFVLDASVTCAWFFADEMTPTLDALLQRATETETYVPALWRCEVLNTFVQASRRGLITDEQVVQFWSQLEGLMIRTPAYEPPANEIVAICAQYQLTAYDACYLALARWLKLPLATLDDALAKAAKSEGIVVLGAE